MTRALLILSLLGLCSASAAAQVCAGGVELLTQDDVDAFDCRVVLGTLSIGERGVYQTPAPSRVPPDPPIRSLRPLLGLTHVSGTLIVQRTSELRTLEGLEGLWEVGGLSLYGNEALEDVEALSGLRVVMGVLTVFNNEALRDLRACVRCGGSTRTSTSPRTIGSWSWTA